MFTKTILKSGLRLIKVPMNSVKSVTVLVMIETGSRYETRSLNGISHFLEHMPAKGTAKRPTSLAVSCAIDAVGASWNAFTAKEYTGFFIKASSEHLEFGLDILSDMLLNPIFDPKEIDTERGVILEEINMYEDQPQARVGELYEELLYRNSPLAMRVLGHKDSLFRINQTTLFDYLHQKYHTQSMVVGIAGDLNGKSKIDDLVEKYFGEVKKGAANKFKPASDDQTKPQSLVHFKQSDQAHLCLGVRSYPVNHPDRYVLAVLNTILGGNMSSRLFLEIREKRGLAYYVHSGTEEFQDCGYFVIQAGLRISAAGEAIKIIIEQLDLIRAKPAFADELRRAKDYWKGRMVLALEDSYRVATFYTSQEVLEKQVETPEEILEKVEEVTAEDIQRVAKDVFASNKLNLAIIGPFKDQAQFATILKL